jgi:hypothetical protein
MITRPVTSTASKLILRSRPVPGTESDTGKRFVEGQVALSLGESWDKSWQYVETPSGSGWASSQYLTSATVKAPSAPPSTAAKQLYTLDGEDPDLTEAIDKLARWAATEGIEFTTADFGGVRTQADTTRILKYRDDDYAVYVRNLREKSPGKTPVPKTTWRPINPFGTSMHNYGCARDLRITKRPSSFSESEALHRLGGLAPQCGLRWGGAFHRPDPPHFELPITLEQAKQRWEERNA